MILQNYSVNIDNSGDQLAKKVRNAQLEGYNFIGVIGPEECKNNQINLRKRDQEEPIGKFDVAGLVKMFSELRPPKSKKRLEVEGKSFKIWAHIHDQKNLYFWFTHLFYRFLLNW